MGSSVGFSAGVAVGLSVGFLCGVLTLLRVLLFLAQGKGIVRVRLALPGSVRRPGCFLRGGGGGRGYRRGRRSTVSILQGGIIFVGAVLDHDLVVPIYVGDSVLNHMYMLAVRTRYYVNAAFADIVSTRKGRGCNGRNNRHDGCRRQHPQS